MFLITISPELKEQQSFSVEPLREVSHEPSWLSLPKESGDITELLRPSSWFLLTVWYFSWLLIRLKFSFQKFPLPLTGVAIKVWFRFMLTPQSILPWGKVVLQRLSTGERLPVKHSSMLKSGELLASLSLRFEILLLESGEGDSDE